MPLSGKVNTIYQCWTLNFKIQIVSCGKRAIKISKKIYKQKQCLFFRDKYLKKLSTISQLQK